VHVKKAHFLAALLLAACSDASDIDGPPATSIAVGRIADGLQAPVFLTAPAGDSRQFVVEQPGRIRIVANNAVLPTPFLDISARVGSGGERGLLGLAFHPNHATNGWFYVDYTDTSGNTRIERYTVSSNAAVADASSAKLILTVAQPFANHNGRLPAFGPDGKLYLGMGDGGSAGDPQGNGQNRNSLLGKILRIDVDNGDPYAIPANNPFVGTAGARGEVWAWGLRNPWRFAFDRTDGMLYIGDVGQGRYEEIDAVPATTAGANFGWNVREGDHCYPSGTSCSSTGLVAPVLEYSHDDGCSVTGGFVYRGSIASLRGHYFYGDYCGGWVRSFRLQASGTTERTEWSFGSIGRILSFGEDALGEVYVLTDAGVVWRIIQALPD
jgi:glucose/arabinose dehydrogenase